MSNSREGSLPECWGHRGASAAWPENTLASFEAAVKDGAHGIESDVHVSKDEQLIMFHDPRLARTTGSHGKIKDRNWYGPDGMEHLQTIKEPKQHIPTFAETLAFLLKPENKHITLNIDIKVFNDPTQLFTLMHRIISSFPSWETFLAPRILLGLWHPSFLAAARERVPYLRRSHIGISPHIARKFFWEGCEAFSMLFAALCTASGQRFIRECKAAGKKVLVWTVNKPQQMMEAVRWGVHAILTDVTQVYLNLHQKLQENYLKAFEPFDGTMGRLFLWTSPFYFTPIQLLFWMLQMYLLQRFGGRMDKFPVSGTKGLKVKAT